MNVLRKLKTTAAIAAVWAAAAGPAAAEDELIVATFGGSFAEDTETCHVELFEEQTGADAILTLGSSVTARLTGTRSTSTSSWASSTSTSSCRSSTLTWMRSRPVSTQANRSV